MHLMSMWHGFQGSETSAGGGTLWPDPWIATPIFCSEVTDFLLNTRAINRSGILWRTLMRSAESSGSSAQSHGAEFEIEIDC